MALLSKSSPSSEATEKLGTFKGVFLPNIVQMMGVILFLRLGWILGHVGLANMAMIIVLASSLLLITSLSMISIISNMQVGGGGAYYIISRILGVEFGAAIGILLCLSQIASIVLNISGFTLSIQEFFPHTSPMLIKSSLLSILVIVAYFSTSLALRAQTVILIAIGLSIASIFFGGISPSENPIASSTISSLPFWIGFAMFFPAITGIEVGMSMSGDLKVPNRSLSIGTLSAVLLAFGLYLSLSLFLSYVATPEMLRHHPFIFHELSKFGLLVLIGLWGATFSNSLTGLLGTPRVVQALARDGVLPSFLGQGHGPSNQPRRAMLVIFGIALAVALMANINQIIPMLTMIALVSYGMINFVAFFESFIKNPSWRPSFSFHWSFSLAGCLGCFFAMLLINSVAAILILGLTGLLCLWTSSRKLEGNWDDIRHSLLSFIVQKAMAKLNRLQPNPKSWRPHILTVFDANLEKGLAHFSHCLDQGMGFLTFGTHQGKNAEALCTEENLQKQLEEYNIPAYIHINRLKDDLKQMIENYGFGPLKPNTIILSLNQAQKRFEYFSRLFWDIQKYKKNIILFKDATQLFTEHSISPKKINLWWRGGNQRNFELCLALSYSMSGSTAWNSSTISIKSIVVDEARKKKLEHLFRRYRKKLRIKNLEFESILDPHEAFFPNLIQHSKDVDFTFLGLRECEETESFEKYQSYLLSMIEKTQEVPQLAFALAGENLDFEKIFN